MNPTKLFSIEEAMKRIPGGLKVVGEMAGLLLAESEKLMRQLREAVANGDFATVRRAAHTMRGSAGVFAAQYVEAAAQRLEEMGRNANLDQAADACVDLERELTRLREAMVAADLIRK